MLLLLLVFLFVVLVALFNPLGLKDTLTWIGRIVRGEFVEDEPSYTEEEIARLNQELDGQHRAGID